MEIIQRIELPSARQNKVGHHIFSTNHLIDEGKANDVCNFNIDDGYAVTQIHTK